MKILFFARHFTYLRNFESVLVELARRGHRIHIAVEHSEHLGGQELIDRLTRGYPAITAGLAPRRDDRWYSLAVKLRFGIDYLRYLEPAYAKMPRLRERSRERAPIGLLWLHRHRPFSGPRGRRLLTKTM